MIKKCILFCSLLICLFSFSFLTLKADSISINNNVYLKYSMFVTLEFSDGVYYSFETPQTFSSDVEEMSLYSDYDNSAKYYESTFYTTYYSNYQYNTDYMQFQFDSLRDTKSNKIYTYNDVVRFDVEMYDFVIVDSRSTDLNVAPILYATEITGGLYNLYYYSFDNIGGDVLNLNKNLNGNLVGGYNLFPNIDIQSANDPFVLENFYVPASSYRITNLTSVANGFNVFIPIVPKLTTFNSKSYLNFYETLNGYLDSVHGVLPLTEGFTSWISTAIGGFLKPEILPGISIGAILVTVLAIPLVIAFLKFFAGG